MRKSSSLKRLLPTRKTKSSRPCQLPEPLSLRLKEPNIIGTSLNNLFECRAMTKVLTIPITKSKPKSWPKITIKEDFNSNINLKTMLSNKSLKKALKEKKAQSSFKRMNKFQKIHSKKSSKSTILLNDSNSRHKKLSSCDKWGSFFNLEQSENEILLVKVYSLSFYIFSFKFMENYFKSPLFICLNSLSFDQFNVFPAWWH